MAASHETAARSDDDIEKPYMEDTRRYRPLPPLLPRYL